MEFTAYLYGGFGGHKDVKEIQAESLQAALNNALESWSSLEDVGNAQFIMVADADGNTLIDSFGGQCPEKKEGWSCF